MYIPELAIANKELYILVPYPWFHSAPKKYLAWSRLACMLRSRCLPPSPRSAPSSTLSPLDFPVSPVSRAERFEPCLTSAIANKELYILEPYPWFHSAPSKNTWPGRDWRACCVRDVCHLRRARRHLPRFPRSISL